MYRTKKIGIPRTVWMTTALLAPFALAVWSKKFKAFNTYTIATNLIVGGLLTPVAVALHSRIYEARFVDSSKVIDNLVRNK